MNSDVFISGFGLVSALGIGVKSNLEALQHGQSGIKHIDHLRTNKKGIYPAGEVNLSDDLLMDILINAEIGPEHYSRTLALGLIALEEAIGIAGEEAITGKTGFIGASSVGGLRETETYYQQYKYGGEKSTLFQTHDAADAIEKLAEKVGINGFVTNINTACASSTHAIILGARLIRAGMLDTVIVGGTDALSKLTLNGFNSLFLLDKEVCRPFDKDRNGINLGEGASFLILQSEESLKRSGGVPIARVAGFGVRNDAYHMTATSPNGRGLQAAMEEALLLAHRKPLDIHYINAHGTATPNNDLTEGMAIKGVFGETYPSFSSTKSFTGHCLAAAGAIEASFSLLALQHQFVPPNLNFESPITEHGLVPKLTAQDARINTVMSNSMGMGGYCSSVIFSNN